MSAAAVVSSLTDELRLMTRLTCALTRRGCQRLHESLGPKRSLTLSALALGLTVALAGMALLSSTASPDGQCPAGKPPSPSVVSGGPAALLALASKGAEDGTWSVQSTRLLQNCLSWENARGSALPSGDIRAQLECHNALVRIGEGSDAAVKAKPIRAFGRMAAPVVESDAPSMIQRMQKMLGTVKSTCQQCDQLRSKLHSLRRADSPARDPQKTMVALASVSGFERPASETFESLNLILSILKERIEAGDSDAKDTLLEAAPLRVQLTDCLLSVMRESRILAHALERSHYATKRVQLCKPELLVSAEKLALTQAAALENDSGILFGLGMLMSEASIAPNDAPLFGAGSTSKDLLEDTSGKFVPADIAQSEQTLRRGFDGSVGQDKIEQASLWSIQLCQHAKHLAQLGHDDAVEWRYRSGAKLAAEHDRKQLASHALAQLSYFFFLRQQEEAALAAADEALGFASDPLASYVQVKVQISLGELRTNAQARVAAEQLVGLEGKLHLPDLEAARTQLQATFATWGGVSDSTTARSCMALGDAAYIVICLISKATYSS